MSWHEDSSTGRDTPMALLAECLPILKRRLKNRIAITCGWSISAQPTHFPLLTHSSPSWCFTWRVTGSTVAWSHRRWAVRPSRKLKQEEEDGMIWENSIETYMTPYLREIASLMYKDLSQPGGTGWAGKGSSRWRGHMYTYGQFRLMYGKNHHNTVK